MIITTIISQSLEATIKPSKEVYYKEKSKQNKIDLEK